MKKFLLLVLIISAIISCNEPSENNTIDNSFFYCPLLRIEKGDGEATLYLIDPRPFTEYYPSYAPADPDCIKIYYSDDPTSLSFYKEVDPETVEVHIPDLQNGQAYYFMITSHKQGADSLFSDTLMIVPSADYEPVAFFGDLDFSVEKISLSSDKLYLTFFSNDYTVYPSHPGALLYMDIAVDTIKVVEDGGYDASWSPDSNTFVYLVSTEVGYSIYPSGLKLFNAATESASTLFDIDFTEYYVISPVFSADGRLIYYLSSEGNTQIFHYDVWSYDIETGTKTRITEFEIQEFYTDSKLNCSPDGESIYLDGHYGTGGYSNTVYKLDIPDALLTPVIESAWDDRYPSASPDNKRIAFVSDRSGWDELWICDLTTSDYIQVTGQTAAEFDPRYTNIQWLDNSNVLVTLFENTRLKAVSIKVD